VQDSKPAIEQQLSASKMPQDPEMDFDEWMSYIDDNAHHFTTYVLELLFWYLLCRNNDRLLFDRSVV